MQRLGKEREEAIAAARAAAVVLMRHFGAIQREQIDLKGAADFVTFVDKSSEQLIIDRLSRAFPAHSFYAEESSRADGGGCRWIIDPLDGTTNYIHAIPVFSISIALEVEGEIQFGLVLDPVRDELFTAEKGDGATCNGAAIAVSATTEPGRSLLATGFPFKQKHHLDIYLEAFRALFLQVSGVRRLGSAALDLCYVACGRFEGYWEMGLSPWDAAAASLILTEAGGRISDFSGGDRAVWSGNVVASNGRLHEMMLQVTRRHLAPLVAGA
ncbi:MAG TPA: inositol monophosphatase family protein [bacterium]|nr:inositol monophosphatase family protein [bacterium]HQG44304.1 inositol monophosphatase family protein [bacterium]HQI49951.1 inositol monophosphatase family protein [bacterium]HQJ63641.1 inositol monophosphatase family protein [bacterium]